MKPLRFFLFAALAVSISCSLSGQNPDVKDDLSKAQNLARQGNTVEASKIYLDIMGNFPDNREAVQGWLMINMKRTPTGEEEAIKQLDELESTYTANTAIVFFKTYLLSEYKHYDEALINVNKLIKMKPDISEYWLLKGQVSEVINKNDDALVAYEMATSLDTKNPDAWQSKAGFFAKTDKLDDAILSYNKAIELVPDQPANVYNRGCVYCRKGDRTNALSDLGKAISMNPQFKSYAPTDEDFKSLWEDVDFKKVTAQ